VLAQLDINDASVIAPLMYALRTRYAIRDQVNAAVKRLGDRAVAPLVGALRLTYPYAVALALVDLGDLAVPPLIAELGSPNGQVKQWAADILGQIGDPRALEPLRRAASDSRSNVRFHVLHALARIDPIAGRTEITNAAERDPDWGTRREAIVRVAKHDSGRAVTLVAALAADPAMGLFACLELRRMGDEGVRALQEFLTREPSASRLNAALALGWRDATAINVLVPVLRDKSSDTKLRLRASSALGLTADPSALETQLMILSDRLEPVSLRATAARALQAGVQSRHYSALIEALKDPEPPVRAGAIDGLASPHYPGAIEPIALMLNDSEEYVRIYAAYAFARLADRRAFDPLLRALADSAPGVRSAAITALGWLRDRRAIPAIERLLAGEEDAQVREEGIRVLHNLRLLKD
jgi:HEAT repeat protein